MTVNNNAEIKISNLKDLGNMLLAHSDVMAEIGDYMNMAEAVDSNSIQISEWSNNELDSEEDIYNSILDYINSLKQTVVEVEAGIQALKNMQ